MRSFYFSVNQVSVHPLLRLLERAPAKKFDEIRNFADSTVSRSIHL